MTDLPLTEEQQAVVAHSQGPALVFAVAGAGKTTAMVHRIERLVREQVFAPQKILATSFNRDAALELERRLTRWPHCQAVKCMTLHGLGWRIINFAKKQGLLSTESVLPQDEHAASNIYWEMLKVARSNPKEFPQLDNLDREDFLDYVSRCKGNLCYANLNEALLPDAALAWAKQVEAPENLPHYLTLYQLYEQVRGKNQLFTFDDLLIVAWELLWRYPSLLKRFQNLYDCILVDEFQDVNLAQSEILNLLAQPHGNFMVIGDDDQTIYEWRGASPRFILVFEARYKATAYTLTDNFRCKASQIVLANGVIRQNQNRKPKQLHLTQGFGGQTHFELCQDSQEMAKNLVQNIQACRAEGVEWQEMAILVRTWAQTPLIEHQLLKAELPFYLPKSKRFYERPEIHDLLSYLRLAQLNLRLADGQGLPPKEFKVLSDTLRRLQNRPNRYISQSISKEIMREILGPGKGHSLQNALRIVAAGSEDYVSDNLLKLADVLGELGRAWLEMLPAETTLRNLEQRLGWCNWLIKNSASPEAGEEKAESVMAFLDYARTQGNLQELMAELTRLSQNQLDDKKLDRSNALLLTTLHTAKGLEWPVVFIPGCNEGIFPGRKATSSEAEADCRLLYVGLTRSRNQLYLYATRTLPVSPFLERAPMRALLQQTQELDALLEQSAQSWRWNDFPRFLRLVAQLDLGRFFEQWFSLPTPVQQKLQGWIAWMQQNRPKQVLPDIAAIWQSNQTAEELLSESDVQDLKAMYERQQDLQPGQVRHPNYGTGLVIRRISTETSRMVVVNFQKSGRVQLPITDPELEWGPLEPPN